ncbi:MAG: hypothetical protein HYZ23_01020 [Chloroflexi bacterium]|nr:hypothetical protein [Chloroflexota bacterium]
MGKYNQNFAPQQATNRSKEPHGVWRGIGCVMMMFLPFVSIVIGSTIVQIGIDSKWPIPYEMMQPVKLPEWLTATAGLQTIFGWIGKIPHFYANASASLMVLILLSGLISMIYAITFRIVGPPKYGPTDAPPEKVKITKKSR